MSGKSSTNGNSKPSRFLKQKKLLPFTFLATNTINPELLFDLYGCRVDDSHLIDAQALRKTNYVSSDYEKYCNNPADGTHYEYLPVQNYAKKKTTDTQKESTALSRNARALKRLCQPFSIEIERLQPDQILQYKISEKTRSFVMSLMGVKPFQGFPEISTPTSKQPIPVAPQPITTSPPQKRIRTEAKNDDDDDDDDVILLSDDDDTQPSGKPFSALPTQQTILAVENPHKRYQLLPAIHVPYKILPNPTPVDDKKPIQLFFPNNPPRLFNAPSLKLPVYDDDDVICLDDDPNEKQKIESSPFIDSIHQPSYITNLYGPNQPLVFCTQLNVINTNQGPIMANPINTPFVTRINPDGTTTMIITSNHFGTS